MAKYRHIYCDFWKDDKVFEDFTPEDKLFYIYLLTNGETKQIGIYKIKKITITSEIGYGWNTIENLIDRFENYHNLIKFNKETREICLLKWGKYNLRKAGKPIFDCVRSELKELNDPSLIEDIIKNSEGNINNSILKIFHDYLINLNTYTSTYTLTIRRQNENENENKKNNNTFLSEQNSDEENLPEELPEEKPKVPKKIFPEDGPEIYLAKYLFNFIKNNNQEAKEPNIQSWAKHFDLILRIDKREIQQVKQVIEWCQKDTFWLGVILSPAKLRKQYDQLILKMKNKSSPITTKNKPTQATNYKQREYSEEYFQKLYENLGGG